MWNVQNRQIHRPKNRSVVTLGCGARDRKSLGVPAKGWGMMKWSKIVCNGTIFNILKSHWLLHFKWVLMYDVWIISQSYYQKKKREREKGQKHKALMVPNMQRSHCQSLWCPSGKPWSIPFQIHLLPDLHPIISSVLLKLGYKLCF